MLKVLNNRYDIKRAQQIFKNKLSSFADKIVRVVIGYPGGNFKTRVSWIGQEGFWVYSKIIEERYVNAFGINEPSEGDMIPITCEINFPLSGINRRIGGVFLTDSIGNVFVGHRGKIGGGKKGIGKTLFENRYRGQWETVEDGGLTTEIALIGALNSPRFVNQVKQFIFEVKRIRSFASNTLSKTTIPVTKGFRQEFYGKKKQYKQSQILEAECDHGLIVNHLSSILEERGMTVGNDKNRDLYIVDSKREIACIFEIKTDISTTSLYSAVGQLILNSIGLNKQPRLILVIPEHLDKTLRKKLQQLSIESLIFKWIHDKPIFPQLRALYP